MSGFYPTGPVGEPFPGAAADARYAQALGLYGDGELSREEAQAAGVSRQELDRIDQEEDDALALEHGFDGLEEEDVRDVSARELDELYRSNEEGPEA